MTRPSRTRATRGRALLALAALLASGCLGRPLPRDRSFRIELGAPERLAAPVLPGILEVDRLRANAVVRRTALVYVTEPDAPELHSRPYEYWADSPTLLVQRQMAAWLEAAGFADRVVVPETGVEPDYRLGGELVRFEEQRGTGAPRVVVEIALALVDERSREILLQASYREERAATGPDAADAVRAYDAALAALLARFVADAGARP